MSGSLETVDNRPAVRIERRLDHPVERVWRANRAGRRRAFGAVGGLKADSNRTWRWSKAVTEL
jgi:hypothetical protein